MNYSIEGELAQVVRLRLDSGQTCWASKGALISYTTGVEWALKMPGGPSKAVRRALAGESLALTLVKAVSDGTETILSSSQPGKIIAWHLKKQGPVVATRGSFVGAVGRIEIDVTVARSPGAAVFGGAGLFLQKLSGDGTAFIHGAGDFIHYDLGPDDVLFVSTGSLAAFSSSVDYDIQRVKGFRRIIFGGEGLFMTRLRGSGSVLLQSLKRTSGNKA